MRPRRANKLWGDVFGGYSGAGLKQDRTDRNDTRNPVRYVAIPLEIDPPVRPVSGSDLI